MKTAKKILCLMIVLVMALGMVPIAFANAPTNVDDYRDFEDIKQKEAVDVMTALGILTGYEVSGGFEFRPSEFITRAEAAKIITYVTIGKTAADRLALVPTQFKDVPATHWASGFVAYCSDRHIIAGYGDGNFGPSDNVTAAQMAKMLLVALGYGRNDEYVGTNWMLNAIVDGQRVDRTGGDFPNMAILTGNANFAAAATRDEIALYTFNALRSNLVSWSPILGIYLTGYESGWQQFGPQVSLGRDTFNLHRRVIGDGGFGYSLRYYDLGNRNVPITGNYMHDNIVESFVAGAAHTLNYFETNYTWPSAGEWVGVTNPPSNPYAVEYFINGDKIIIINKDQLAERGNNNRPFPGGALVNFIDNNRDGIIDKIVVEYELLGVVRTVNAAAGTITAQVYMPDDNSRTNFGGRIDATGLAIGDFVLIAPSHKEKTTDIKKLDPDLNAAAIRTLKADSMTETATFAAGGFAGSFPGDPNFQTITVGGQVYNLSAGIGMGFGTNNMPSFTGNSRFLLDSNGLIIGYESAVAPTGAAGMNYIYVTAAQRFPGNFGRDGTIYLTGYTTTGDIYNDGIQLASYTVGSTDYPYVLKHDADSTPGTGNLSGAVVLTGQDPFNGFNSTTAANLSTNTYGWFSYTITDAGHIRLQEPRTNVTVKSNPTNDEIKRNPPNALDIIYGPAGVATGTSLRATEASVLSIAQRGTVTTSTGIGAFPASMGGAGFTHSAAGQDLVRWLIVLEENLAAGTNQPVNPHRVARVFVVRAAAPAPPGEYGIIVSIAGSGSGFTAFNVLRAGATEVEYIEVVAASTALVAGTIIRTTPHATQTGRFNAVTAPPNIAGIAGFTRVEGSLEFIESGSLSIGGSHFLINDNTIFLRRNGDPVTNGLAPGYTLNERPSIGGAGPGSFKADYVTLWAATVNNALTAVAVMSVPDGLN